MNPQFTLVLPLHKYRKNFDTTQFTETFPESMVSLALQSGETIVELDHPIVTPEVIDLLYTIVSTSQYPIPTGIRQVASPTYPYVDPKLKKELDYLGIDLPAMVYNPKYRQIEGSDLKKVDVSYDTWLAWARKLHFPELAHYIFSVTSPDRHSGTDFHEFMSILRDDKSCEEDIQIAVMLLRDRNVRESAPDDDRAQNCHDSTMFSRIMEKESPDLYISYFRKYPQAVDRWSMVWSMLHWMYSGSEYALYEQVLLQLGSYIRPDMKEYPLYQLFLAVVHGDLELVRKYLPALGHLEIYVHQGYTLTILALRHHHYDVAQLLINLAVDIVSDEEELVWSWFYGIVETGAVSEVKGQDLLISNFAKIFPRDIESYVKHVKPPIEPDGNSYWDWLKELFW